MTTRIVWKHFAQLGPFRWDRIAAEAAARSAFGVVVPLAIGCASGHVAFGAYAALGASSAGIASFQGESRTRFAGVVVASIGMALSTFVGATTAATAAWLLVPIVAIWGYFTGLAVALGPRWSMVVLQWSVALLIAVGLPFGPAGAGVRALFVLAGGLFQAVLIAASWPLRPGLREREALADSYRALATYASLLATGEFAAPPPAAFAADAAILDANPLLPSSVQLTFIDLLEEAERIRASLAALAATSDDPERRALMRDAALAITLIADALTATRTRRTRLISEIEQALIDRSVTADPPWRWAGEALLGQLRAVARIVASLEAVRPQEHAEGGHEARPAIPHQSTAAWVLITLRANMATASEAGRHALRLAVTAALAEALVQATGLYQGRWVTLTIFLVLRPDYASTVYRGVQRALYHCRITVNS